MKSAKPHIPKAPIYNPYDKFSQHDFDAWIGDITGTLRKVLRHEDEEPAPQPQEDKWYYRIGDEEQPKINGYREEEDNNENSGEEQLDDSFAELRAKRVKGKARDPREGPGLGAGTMNEPIELGSGDEEGDEEAEITENNSDEEFDEVEYSDESGGADYEYEEEHAQGSRRPAASSSRRRAVVEAHAEEEQEEDDDDDEVGQQFTEVDYEEEEEEELPSGEASIEDIRDTNAQSDEEGKLSSASASTSTRRIIANEHVQRGASPEDDVQGIIILTEEDQPILENTAFPLGVEPNELSSSQDLVLPDLWEGPQTYAEDYYSGGDIIHDSSFPLSADVLNEHDDNESGFFLTPGLLTPNGDNAVSPAASGKDQTASPKEDLPELFHGSHDENVKLNNERNGSPLPGSSPIPMSPELDLEEHYVNEQQSPVHILSDDEFEEEIQFDMRDERSSPPPEYEIDDELDGSPDDRYQDDEGEEADDIVLPLGTSDLDMNDEVNVEVEREIVGEVDPEQSMGEVGILIIEDLHAPLQEDADDNALLQEDAFPSKTEPTHRTELGETIDMLPVTDDEEAAIKVLSEAVQANKKNAAEIAIVAFEVNEDVHVGLGSQPIQEDEDASRSSLLLPVTDIEIAVTVRDGEAEELRELGDIDDVNDAYSVFSILSNEGNDLADGDYDLDVESIAGTDSVTNSYEVEEITTQGRLTVEPEVYAEISEDISFLNVPDVPERSGEEEPMQDTNNISGGATSDDVPADVSDEAYDTLTESNLPLDNIPQISSLSAAQIPASHAADGVAVAAVSVDDPSQISMPSEAQTLPAQTTDESGVAAKEHTVAPAMSDVTASVHRIQEAFSPLLSPAVSSILADTRNITTNRTKTNPASDALDHLLDVPFTRDAIQVPDTSLQSIPTTVSESQTHISLTELPAPPSDDISMKRASAFVSVEENSVKSSSNPFIPELSTMKGVPILHVDPFPASLSTPNVDADESSTDEEVDEIDHDSIISNEVSSSNSSFEEDKSLPIRSELPLQAADDELDENADDLEMDLQYPPSDDEKAAPPPSVGIFQTVSIADDLDFDAEGDIDPDFVVDTNGEATTDTFNKDESQVIIEKILAEHTTKPLVPSSIPTTSQIIDVESNPVQSSSKLEGQKSEDLSVNKKLDCHVDDVDVRTSASMKTHVTAGVNDADEDLGSNPVKFVSPVLTGSTEPASAPILISEVEKQEQIIGQGVDGGPSEIVASLVGEPAAKVESLHPEVTSSIPRIADDNPIKSPRSPKSPGISTTRRTKRKRKSAITLPNGSSAASGNSHSAINKGKGKKKAAPHDISDTASTSSASVAAQILTGGSRASSILSTSTGDGSAHTNPSPTPLRVKDLTSSSARFSAPPLPPPPPPLPQLMLHNHAKKAPATIRRPTLTVDTELPRTIALSLPLSQPTAAASSLQQRSPDEDTPSFRSGTPAPHILRREPSSNSPVTRSHCRYHKISLPEEDENAHIFFLVPGCSLVNRKVIKDEDIIDHGDATYEDSIRKVADIATLGINEYVIGVIRMLVGPDKEHEVYFLPRPGEERSRKVIHRVRKSRLSRSSISSSAGLGSPRTSTSNINGNVFSPSSSSLAPVSAAGSSSTNRSSRHRRRQHDREKEADSSLWSETYSTETDSENNEDSDGGYEGPGHKKPKLMHPSVGLELSNQRFFESSNPKQEHLGDSASAGPGPRTKAKRKRPLDPSAAEYKPEEDAGNESIGDEDIAKSKKNALKRARTSEATLSTIPKEERHRKRKKAKTVKMVPYGFHH
ncbi:hypothetical protein J3R30DRAFT_3698323 [Lentinula aciculospora]|uniref:Uncharacterized protein n=1 Tax=Lentinula aciculospora TaxID=153920 RepID=A0A9W9AID7_9AGAR|nr:hypothetical protein J3R30DRAFT_3698323 [Lentinula aciculospora]